MTFVYPVFLWALVALAIPVIIHLFNFRKTTRVFFTNNRFLKQVKETTTAKRRLKHYLILASRLLFILFLVLAFAQPFIPADQQLQSQKDVVIYLDNSLSMSAQVRERTRAFDEGIATVQALAEVLPADANYKLITNDFASYSNTYKTRGELIDLLSEIRLSPMSRTIAEVKEKIQSGGNEAEVFWISDFQKSTAGERPTSADSLVGWHLVPIDLKNETNVFVDTAYLENPFTTAGQMNRLTLVLRQSGDKSIENLSVKLTIDQVQAGTTSVNIPPAGSAEVKFDLPGNQKGFHRAVISFADFPVSFDNEFYLALNLADKIKIVEIKDVRQPTSVEKVFGNDRVFSAQSFHRSAIPPVLQEADLVVLNGIDNPDNSLTAALQNFLKESGTLVVIPGTNPDVLTYQKLLALPLKLVDDAGLLELARPDFSNPFFEQVFEERTRQLAMPKGRARWDWGTDRSAIIKTFDGRPFISRLQNGTVYLLAAPLQPSYTTLDSHALFVPVMYKMAASARKELMQLYATLRQDFISLKADSIIGEEPVKLVGKQEIVPSQRRLNKSLQLELPRFSIDRGFYEVIAQQDTLALVAINQSTEESVLTALKTEEIRKFFGGKVTFFEASESGAFGNEIKERYLGKPLWKYALILALFFLLIEVLLVRFLK